MFIIIVSDDVRQASIATTIKLYNKARLVVAPSFLETKTYLKAAAAWMLTAYGGVKFKSLASCIRLHCRSATELVLHFEGDSTAAQKCLTQAIDNWTHINNQALERMVSAADLEELRLYIFHCYVALGRLLVRTRSLSVRDVKASVAGAMEVVQYLPNLRLSFAQHAADIGYYLASQDFMADSVSYFQRAITVLDLLAQEPSHNDPEEKTTTEARNLLKVKACLSLAYVYNELNKFDQAIKYIEMVESIPHVDRDIVLFSKFSVASKHGNVEKCSEYAEQIISTTDSYSIALNTLTIFCESCGDFTRRGHLYEALLEAFPR
jgi:tetratricopeptide (TPR) repeat protein